MMMMSGHHKCCDVGKLIRTSKKEKVVSWIQPLHDEMKKIKIAESCSARSKVILNH